MSKAVGAPAFRFRRRAVVAVTVAAALARFSNVDDWAAIPRGDPAPPPSPSDWPTVKEALCPGAVPDRRAWTALFDLARAELGLPGDPAEEDRREQANFFRFNAGGMGASSTDGRTALAYLRVYKGGNAAIMKNIDATYRRTARSIWMVSLISELWKWTSEKNHTCVVTAVRDPVEHFLSGYNELMDRRQGQRGRTSQATAENFDRFVRGFVGGPVSHGLYKSRMQHLELTHVYSMSGILWGLGRLRECHGDKAPTLTAYLPSLTNLSVDFPKMVKEHCPGLPMGGTFAEGARHRSESDRFGFRASAWAAWEAGGPTSRALCAIHALDYACFDALPVPDLCLDVFANRTFREELLGAARNESGGSHASDPCGREFPAI